MISLALVHHLAGQSQKGPNLGSKSFEAQTLACCRQASRVDGIHASRVVAGNFLALGLAPEA